jgi:hypothetical protein
MKLRKVMVSALAAAVAVFMSAAPTMAKGGGSPKSPKVKASAPKVKPAGPKAAGPKGAGSKSVGGAKSTGPKSVGGAKGAKAPKGSTGGAAKAAKGKTATGAKSADTAVKEHPLPQPPQELPPGEPVPPAEMTKAQQKLANNPNLRAKLQSRLPPGTDIYAAAAGFSNFGQFVAAVNNSYNHNLSFEALKALMTGPEAMSLGQAKKQLGVVDPAPVPIPPETQR